MKVDLYALTSNDDPYPVYRELRDTHPVLRDEEQDYWVLSRYQEVRAALLDPGTYSSAQGINPSGFLGTVPMMIMMDPPRQTQLRKLLQRSLAPSQVRAMEKMVREIVTGLIDDFAVRGECDFYREFAVALPVEVLSRMLGVRVDDRDTFIELCNQIVTAPDGTVDEVLDAQRQLLAYFEKVIPERRRNPGDDLISMLLAPTDQPPPTEEELLGFAFLLMIAGTETTTNLLTNSCVLIDRHHDVREHLIANPEAIPRAVEEFLRFESPVQGLMRTTTREVEILGHRIPTGSRVHMLFGSANRDERAFAHAESLDIERHPNDHFGFGFGIHYCMGAGLARLEGRVAVEEVLARMPNYSLDHDALERLCGFSNRGYTRVPMSFESAETLAI
jgi:cytochrome P450